VCVDEYIGAQFEADGHLDVPLSQEPAVAEIPPVLW
jgi:hypothetical protein